MPTLPASIRSALGNRPTLLLVFAPFSWVAHWVGPDTPWPFILGAISVVPLAGLIGHAHDAALPSLRNRRGRPLSGRDDHRRV